MIPPSLTTLYHEAGHLVVAKHEGWLMSGIEFFPPGHQFGAIGLNQPDPRFRSNRGHLSSQVRIKIAGIHSQAIFAPESFSANIRLALEQSAFLHGNHPFYGVLSKEEIAELDVAETDLESSFNLVARISRGGRAKRYHYLTVREREVRQFLRMPSTRRRVRSLVKSVEEWFSADGPLQEPHMAFYPGSYCRFPGGLVDQALTR